MASFSLHKQQNSWEHPQNNISKHEIIQKFKQSQKQKSILKNKLNILKKQCEKNNKKAKSIQSSLKKVNKIKQNYKRNQTEIQQLLRKNRLKDDQKIANVLIRKQQSQGKLPLIKQMIFRQKSNDYLLIKKKSLDIQQKLKVYRNSVISDRQKTVHKVKEQQSMVPFNRTIYVNTRNKNARLQQQMEAAKIERKFKKSIVELQQMKYLEDQILQKLNKSRTQLNKSMSKLTHGLRS